MKDFVKNNIKLVLVFILGVVVSGVGVYALTVGADQITYDNSKSGIQANNVADAIDELYAKAESSSSECLNGYAVEQSNDDYVCVKVAKVVYNSNGGVFSNNSTSNIVYYKNTGSVVNTYDGTYLLAGKEGYYAFSGWNTEADGSGVSFIDENAVKVSLVNGTSITLYAQFEYFTGLCKRATTLHTEVCNNTGCGGVGSIITYGSLGTKGVLTAGDAFDCDVNGDGIYNSSTERFYYVSNLWSAPFSGSGGYDANYAVLIYYSNTESGVAGKGVKVAYGTTTSLASRPDVAVLQLPTTEQWSNTTLKGNKRYIAHCGSVTSGCSIEKGYAQFDYSGYAARLITIPEIYSACGSGGSLSNCQFFKEKTNYFNNSYGAVSSWIENKSSYNPWMLSYSSVSYDQYTYATSVACGVRPAIDVEKSKIYY